MHGLWVVAPSKLADLQLRRQQWVQWVLACSSSPWPSDRPVTVLPVMVWYVSGRACYRALQSADYTAAEVWLTLMRRCWWSQTSDLSPTQFRLRLSFDVSSSSVDVTFTIRLAVAHTHRYRNISYCRTLFRWQFFSINLDIFGSGTWSHIATHLVVVVVVGVTLFKKSLRLRRFKLDRKKFGTIVPK